MKIKKMILTAAAVLLTASGVRADDWWSNHMAYDKQHDQLFNANELQLDLFGEYRVNADRFFPSNFHDNKWGGGVGANYFFCRYVGIGADTSFLASTRHFDDHVGGNLFVRIPIEVVRLAPYVFGGGGRSFNPYSNWFEDFGVGVEFRLNPHLAIFGDGQYIWRQDEVHESAIRSGIRLVF